MWQGQRLREKLAEYAMVGQINAQGLISVSGRNSSVGRKDAGQTAYVRLDAESGDWLFELADGPVIGRYPAEVPREAIFARRVTRRHHGRPPVASGGQD